VPITNTPQYLGDLEDNSPLPFSIPLAIGINDNNGNTSSLAAGNYPLSLRITYSDELRNTHAVILNRTVSYNPPQQEENSTPNQGFLGFGSSTEESGTTTSVLPLVLIFAGVVAAAVVIIIVIRRRSRTKKISRLMAGQGDDDDFEVSSEEHLGSSGEDKSSHKQ
jgi:hypothetical protein